jgi:hypothetical protein
MMWEEIFEVVEEVDKELAEDGPEEVVVTAVELSDMVEEAEDDSEVEDELDSDVVEELSLVLLLASLVVEELDSELVVLLASLVVVEELDS